MNMAFGFLPFAAQADMLTSTRALALQGGAGSPYDNGAIYGNPAGVALNPRYDLSAFGRLQNASEDNRSINVSIVDSMSSADIGAGLGWNRELGTRLPKDDIALALSQKYTVGALGVTGHYRYDRERLARKSDVNLDAGFFISTLNQHLNIGILGSNLAPTPKAVHDVHRRWVAGIGSRWADIVEVTGDLGYNPGFKSGTRFDWAAGIEVTPLPYASVRGGYAHVPSGPERQARWSAGVGGGIPQQFKAGYTYLEPVGHPENAVHAAEITAYVF